MTTKIFGCGAALLVASLATTGCNEATSNDGAAGGASTSTSVGQGGQGGTTGNGGNGGGSGGDFVCDDARALALVVVDEVSSGAVTVLETEGGVSLLYLDASAGGFQSAADNPAVYLDLGATQRVDITDDEAFAATSWDLAFKRVAIRHNSGDAGPGQGAAAFLDGADFDEITTDDASDAALEQEQWFDEACEYETDATGALSTTMSDWYDYAPDTMTVSPKDGVYVVRGADGATFFKVEIVDYYANPDGTPGQTSGRYLLRVAEL